LKVALLSHEGGGISSVARGLAAGLSKKKIDTTVFTTTASNVGTVEENACQYNVVSLPMIDLPPRSLWFHLRNSSLLSRMLEDYDIVHAVSPEMAILFMLKKLGRPLITTLHGSHRAALKAFACSPFRSWALGDFAFNVLELPLHQTITKWCFDRSDRVVVCSFSTLAEIEMYENVDVSKATVIYNGIDFTDIGRDVKASDGKEDKEKKPTMIYAGRLFWMKGIPYVLKAFERVKKDVKEARLRIFGKGPMEKEVKRFRKQKHLQDDIFLGGFLPHRELMKEIRMADVVVFPSLYESQPMFALEAMACKKPLVAFSLPYAREIIKDGHNGLLAQAYDVEDLSSKIALALQDKELRFRLGEKGYEYVEENHNWDIQVNKYLQLYKETIN
jgi:glycosyltransferase involved in cell wall biosynthesis